MKMKSLVFKLFYYFSNNVYHEPESFRQENLTIQDKLVFCLPLRMWSPCDIGIYTLHPRMQAQTENPKLSKKPAPEEQLYWGLLASTGPSPGSGSHLGSELVEGRSVCMYVSLYVCMNVCMYQLFIYPFLHNSGFQIDNFENVENQGADIPRQLIKTPIVWAYFVLCQIHKLILLLSL